MTLAYPSTAFEDVLGDPLELLENLIGSNGWSCERLSEDEITAEIPGTWCAYHLRFYWKEDERVLQTASIVDLKIPKVKRQAVYEVLSRINERLWMGHFELWSDEGALMYRHATLVDSIGEGASAELCSSLMRAAVEECERYYPVFQYILWAGKSPAEAIDAALIETAGEA